MHNRLLSFIRRYDMIREDDHVICAVSGGADSVALLFAMYLLKDKLGIRLSAAHFNHHLRGEESDRDEAFVRDLCDRYDIPLYVGGETVVKGKKGLEAAARDARYGFLKSLPGKIATAHTADDNGETVLLHLVRGTGLKGLGGIAPINGNLIRPMLSVTRQEVEDFLAEWCLDHITDSSNQEDGFLRNRLRHHVMPVLKDENPRIAEALSAMALELRQDEACLSRMIPEQMPDVDTLKAMDPALRSRCIERFLKSAGVREPERTHIAQTEALLWSEKPSARAMLPGGVVVARNYGSLEILGKQDVLPTVVLPCPGSVTFGDYRITCMEADHPVNTPDTCTVRPIGEIRVRTRMAGDSIRLPGGSKSLKKLFIDRKVPAAARLQIPVLADEAGVLGVYSIGADMTRRAESAPAVLIRIDKEK